MVQLKLTPTEAAISSWWGGPCGKEPEEALGVIPGLANLGNTCFMNAVLQCLMNTPAWLAEACRSFDVAQGSEQQPSGKAVLGRGFAQLMTEYNATDGRPLKKGNSALKNMKAAIATLDEQYAGCQQQDAYEFLGCLLEGLEENFQSLYQGGPQASVVRAVCGVTSHTRRTCQRCGSEFRVDENTDTALRVPLLSAAAQMDPALREKEEKEPTSLEALLELARQPEELEDYDCDVCRSAGEGRSTATQRHGIITATRDVLVVVLYRFCGSVDSAGRFKPLKVRRRVACPTVLRMDAGEYELYGAVSHVGQSLSAGHYVAAVRSLRDEMWYECDDERVRPLNLAALYGDRSVTALREGAEPYILFYHLKKKAPADAAPTPPLAVSAEPEAASEELGEQEAEHALVESGAAVREEEAAEGGGKPAPVESGAAIQEDEEVAGHGGKEALGEDLKDPAAPETDAAPAAEEQAAGPEAELSKPMEVVEEEEALLPESRDEGPEGWVLLEKEEQEAPKEKEETPRSQGGRERKLAQKGKQGGQLLLAKRPRGPAQRRSACALLYTALRSVGRLVFDEFAASVLRALRAHLTEPLHETLTMGDRAYALTN